MAVSGAPKPASPKGRSEAKTPPRAALMARLQEIGAAHQPEDVLQPALQAVVEDFRAVAGAICSFDPRHGLLRLLSETGLSDEGCKHLRTVRTGDPSAWEMPLHGVQNRRAYLIENATENRYVPMLLDPKTPARSIVCLPLYAGAEPVGSLILLNTGARGFGESDVQQLQAPSQMIAAMIASLRRAHTQQPDAPASPKPIVPKVDVAAVVAERDALNAVQTQLSNDLLSTNGEVDRLKGLLANAEASLAALALEQANARQQQARLSGEEIAELHERLTAAEADATAARALVETTHATLATREEAATAAATRAATVLGELQARIAELETELASSTRQASTRDAERARANEADAADAAEVLTTTQRTLGELRETHAMLRAERDALQASAATAQSAASDAALTIADLEARLATTARAAADTQRTVEQQERVLQEAHAAQSGLRLELEQHAATIARLEANIADTTQGADGAQRTIERQQRELRDQTHALGALRHELEQHAATIAALTTDRDQQRASVASLTAAGDQLHAASADAQRDAAATIARLEAQLADQAQHAEEAQRTIERQQEELQEREQVQAELRRAVDAHVATIAELGADRAQQAARLTELTTDRDRQAALVAELTTARDQSQAALEAAARDTAETIGRLEATLTERMQSADASQRTLDQQQRALQEHEQTQAVLRHETAQQATTIAELSTRCEQQAAKIADLTTRAEQQTATIADLTADRTQHTATIAELTAARDTLATQLTQAATAASTTATQLDENGAALESVRAQLAATDAAHTTAQQRATEAQALLEHQLAEQRTLLAQAQTDATAGAATIAALQAEIAQSRTESTAHAARVSELEAALQEQTIMRERATADDCEHTNEIARLMAERDALARECGALRAARTAAASESTMTTPTATPPEPPGPSGGTRRPKLVKGATVIDLPTATAASSAAIVVIDGADRWGSMVGERAIRRIAPDAVAVETFAAESVERIIVNLAAPGALDAMLQLRAAGVAAPMWGCLVADDASTGLALGPVERLAVPLDADAAIDALGPAATRSGRVITAGADVDALMSVRQALSRRQAGVSMAWDSKQVADLLEASRPHALLVDLDLPRADGFAIVAAALAVKLPPRLVMFGGDASAHTALLACACAESFAAAQRPLSTLLSELHARPEPIPQDRHAAQRLRAAR